MSESGVVAQRGEHRTVVGQRQRRNRSAVRGCRKLVATWLGITLLPPLPKVYSGRTRHRRGERVAPGR